MSASYTLLGILGKQPSYGYDLKKDYDFLYGKDKPLAFGQVYATLSRLLRDRKITTETTEQVAGPERKLYAITATGRKESSMVRSVRIQRHDDLLGGKERP